MKFPSPYEVALMIATNSRLIALSVLVLFLASFAAQAGGTRMDRLPVEVRSGADVSEVYYVDQNGRSGLAPFSLNHLNPHRRVLFVVLSTKCSHCREQLGLLAPTLSLMDDVDVYLVSPQWIGEVRDFYASVPHSTVAPWVSVLWDKEGDLYKRLAGNPRTPGYPSTFVYGAGLQPLALFEGVTPVPEILQSANLMLDWSKLVR